MSRRFFGWVSALLIGVLIAAVGSVWVAAQRGGRGHAARVSLPAEPKVRPLEATPNVTIDTNAVLVAVLDRASRVVTQLKLPIPAPLAASGVRRFTVSNVLPTPRSSLEGMLEYDGGYEFGFQDGLICSLKTPTAYPRQFRIWPKHYELGRYGFETCLATAELTVLQLGRRGPNLGSNEMRWEASVPLDPKQPHPSRWRFAWDWGNVAAVEVDADDLTVKSFSLSPPHFGGEPWPLDFGRRTLQAAEVASAAGEPAWGELEVRDHDHDFGVVLARGILPEAAEFCRKLGPPFPERVDERDVVPEKSLVFRDFWTGTAAVQLRLRCGVTLGYFAGCVSGATMGDSMEHKPQRDGLFRTSMEYLSTPQLSAEEAAAKVLAVARRFRLSESELWLDTSPVVDSAFQPGATNGLKRHRVQWEMPETREDRERRTARVLGPRSRTILRPLVSVSGEVDAVSGELKAFHNFQSSMASLNPPPE